MSFGFELEVVGLTGIVATGLLVVASIQWLAVNQFVAINGAVFGFLTLRNSCLSYPRSLTKHRARLFASRGWVQQPLDRNTAS